MSGRLRARALLVLAVAGLMAPAARPDAGRIPIWQPTTISATGHYVVTRDISASGNIITIAAVDVVLDLNGHTLTSVSSNSFTVLIQPPNSAPGVIEIKNGRVRGGLRNIMHIGHGPPLANARIRLENLDLSTGYGAPIQIESAPAVEIVHCNVHDTPSFVTAVLIETSLQASATCIITDNVVSNVGGGGIQIDKLIGGVIRNNVVSNYANGVNTAGISIDGAPSASGGSRIDGNTVRGSYAGAQGILVNASAHRTAITRNVVGGTVGSGIVVWSNGNRIVGNVVGGTGSYGMIVYGSDNRLEDNQVQSGSGDGVIVYGGANNLLESNTIEGHQGFGINFQGANCAYHGNMLRNNASGAVSGTATDAGANIP